MFRITVAYLSMDNNAQNALELSSSLPHMNALKTSSASSPITVRKVAIRIGSSFLALPIASS